MFCFPSINVHRLLSFFFFFNDTATTEIYTLSLHDALPICAARPGIERRPFRPPPRISGECDVLIPQRHRTDSLSGCREVGIEHGRRRYADRRFAATGKRSEEHTSELQSRQYLVCRLLL